MFSASYIERQVTVVFIIPMIKAPLLLAMNRVIGGVKVENNFLGSLRVGIQKSIDEQRFNFLRVVDYFFIPFRLVSVLCCQFNAVKRAGRSQRFALVILTVTIFSFDITVANGQGQERIALQILVVIEILIPLGDSIDTLAQQGSQGMFYLVRVAVIREACGEGLCESKTFINLPQQKHAAF